MSQIPVAESGVSGLLVLQLMHGLASILRGFVELRLLC